MENRKKSIIMINHKGNIVKTKLVIPVLLIGGFVTGMSYLFLHCYLAWICLIPLFYVLENANTKQLFLYGGSYGVILASIFYYWIIPVAGKYSGGFTLYSILFYGGTVIYYSIYPAVFAMGYGFLSKRVKSLIPAGVSISGFYVLLEAIRMQLFPGLPWFHYNIAVTQGDNSWIIQWASLGGPYIIIFTIVFFNYIITQFLLRRKIILLQTAMVVITLFFGIGGILKLTNHETPDDIFKTVLLNENTAAETRWNDFTGDSLANKFFRLNENAVKYDPELIVWSETAIPWKLAPDDEFVPKILSITRRSGADHLLGIFSPSSQNNQLVYNSAYLIKGDGRITGRYDKTILLDFLEKPFTGGMLSMLPFINTDRYDNIIPGKSQNIIKCGKARIGVLICNESLYWNKYLKYIKEGANLLVLMSNDAWFENTPLQKHHFYITRIEAVMAGRDVIVNSNRGLTGLIHADGNVEVLRHSDTARIINCNAHLSSKATIYSAILYYCIPVYLILTIFPIFIKRK